MARNCIGISKLGTPCKGQAVANTTPATCRFHSPAAADRNMQREISSRGGQARALLYKLPSIEPLADELGVAQLDFETVGGVKTLLGQVLRKLTQLPFDRGISIAIQQVAGMQRGYIVEGDIVERLAAVEARIRDK